MKVKRRHHYYLWGLMPVSMICLMLLFEVRSTDFLFCFLGFFWPFTLSTPSSWDKWGERTRRFSVLSLSLRLKQKLEQNENIKMPLRLVIARNTPGLIFAFLIQLLVLNRGNMLFTFVGMGLFEAFLYLYLKHHPELAFEHVPLLEAATLPPLPPLPDVDSEQSG